MNMKKLLAVGLAIAGGILAGQTAAQDEFSSNSSAGADTFSYSPSPDMSEGDAPEPAPGQWQADPSSPDDTAVQGDQPDGSPSSSPYQGGTSPYSYAYPGTNPYFQPRQSQGRRLLQGSITMYASPTGDPYCCSGDQMQCFRRANTMLPGCSRSADTTAVSAVRQGEADLLNAASSPSGNGLINFRADVDRFNSSPMTEAVAPYIDCWKQMQIAAIYMRSPVPAMGTQHLQTAVNCMSKVEHVPNTTVPLLGQVDVMIASGPGGSAQRLQATVPFTQTPRGLNAAAGENRQIWVPLKHLAGTNYQYKAGLAVLSHDTAGNPFLTLQQLLDRQNKTHPVNNPHPLPIALPQQSTSVDPNLAAARQASQTAVDFARGLSDGASLGLTAQLRQALQGDAGRIQDLEAADYGDKVQTYLGVLLPAPGAGKLKAAEAAIDLFKQRKFLELTQAQAQAIKDASEAAWALKPFERGNVIEKAVYLLEYKQAGYDWIGIMKGGTFRTFDFANFSRRTLVSFKTLNVSPGNWPRAISYYKSYVTKLAAAQSKGIWGLGASGKLPSRMVLDIRVITGNEHLLNEVVQVGKQNGIEVIVKSF